jgi:transposase
METFVGLDVSLKETSVCVLDQAGTLVFEGKVASEPAAIARLIRKHATDVARVGLESGPTSVWLTHALLAEGLPLVCLDARHAKALSERELVSKYISGRNTELQVNTCIFVEHDITNPRLLFLF